MKAASFFSGIGGGGKVPLSANSFITVMAARMMALRPMPGGGDSVVVSPGSPGGNFGGDPWGMEEPEPASDSFFIHLWNFVRMPIFLIPVVAGAAVGSVLLVKRAKRKSAEIDFDE